MVLTRLAACSLRVLQGQYAQLRCSGAVGQAAEQCRAGGDVGGVADVAGDGLLAQFAVGLGALVAVGAGKEQQVDGAAGDASLDFAQVHKLRAELLRPLRFLVLVADYELMPELANALGQVEPCLELGGERA